MASPAILKHAVSRNRSFESFFGENATMRVWVTLMPDGMDVPEFGTTLKLDEFVCNLSRIIEACEIFIGAAEGIFTAQRDDNVSDEVRRKFLEPPYDSIHRSVFGLARRYPNSWIEGTNDYALRVAHQKHPGGVSLVTSQGPRRLLTGQRR